MHIDFSDFFNVDAVFCPRITETVYGLTEIYRSDIQNARLIENPGRYPTSVQLPLIPLIKANLIEVKNILIDSKYGVSGAAKEANLYSEIAEGIHSYGVTGHRHGGRSLESVLKRECMSFISDCPRITIRLHNFRRLELIRGDYVLTLCTELHWQSSYLDNFYEVQVRLMYQALAYIKEQNLYADTLPFSYSKFIMALLFCYPFLWMKLYMHLFKQRQSKLGKQPKKKRN
ncbi:hypothetical protein CASFOL_037243 [Castilleja foliolosa]|uniref:very-long-chain (3R)-3-hydroxyacyl-CoA dehydratase n=1 Tax=Castilleja foliolosa TaxID=1961234 RepID=A0ABD3BQP1_9LAMI